MFQKLLKWLRNLLGQTFGQDAATDIMLSDKTSALIDEWSQMYETGGSWCSEKTGVHSLQLPATIASEFARLVTIEMQAEPRGSVRADYINTQLKPFLNNIRNYVEPACALGGCVFKPYVSSDSIDIDVVQGDAFFPTTFDTSNRMTGGIFVDQIKRGNFIYTRAEHHEFDGAKHTHTIENKAFVSKSSYSLGREIPLASVTEWADIQPVVTISNVDRPLFAYFRIPKANRQDRHSPLGVSVYADAVRTIRDADEQYGRYIWEYKGGELAVDVAEDLLQHEPNGDVKMPEGQKRLYRARSTSMNGTDFYQIFAPTLRDEAYKRGFNTILQRVEFQCGLAYGTLSDPQDTEKTATEITASKQRSFSTVRDIQLSLQRALDDLVYAMDALATLYNLAPAGKVEMTYSWDDSIVNEPSQQKQMFWQYVVAGKFPFWRYLVDFEGYSEDDAKQIASETDTNIANPFGLKDGGGNASA